MSNIDLMTAAEAAAALRLTRNQVYAAAAGRQIPSLRIGRRLRFSRAAIADWIAAQTAAQIEQTTQSGQADDQGAAIAA